MMRQLPSDSIKRFKYLANDYFLRFSPNENAGRREIRNSPPPPMTSDASPTGAAPGEKGNANALPQLTGVRALAATMVYLHLTPQDVWQQYARAVAQLTRPTPPKQL